MLKKFFSSVKLAISLFLLLLFLSAFGSFVSTTNPQAGILGLVIKITGKSHHEVIDIFTRLGLVDIYHSYLFIFLLILLAINLLVCTVTRLPSVFTILKKEPLINKNIFNDKPYDIEIEHKDEALESKITNMLKSYKIIEECGEDKKVKYITGEKGKLGYLGVHIVHLGVFIILLAGILSGFWGYSGNIAILEGDTDDSVILKDNKTVKLPFKIKLDNFHLSYYDNSSKPKEFKSDIIIHDEGPDKFYTIETNKPLKYKNLWIYQASYGFFPSKDVKFIFNFKAKEMEKKIVVAMDEVYKIDDKISFVVRDFAPSLSLDSQGKLINLNDMMINPAVIVEFMMEGEHNISVPILANYPQTGKFDLFDLQFVKAYGVQFSVLSVNYNPFIWLIYVGFFVLAVGVVITFMFEHKLVFIKIAEDNGKNYIWVNGYRKRFKKDLNRFLTDLKNKIEKIVGNKDE